MREGRREGEGKKTRKVNIWKKKYMSKQEKKRWESRDEVIIKGEGIEREEKMERRSRN